MTKILYHFLELQTLWNNEPYSIFGFTKNLWSNDTYLTFRIININEPSEKTPEMFGIMNLWINLLKHKGLPKFKQSFLLIIHLDLRRLLSE